MKTFKTVLKVIGIQILVTILYTIIQIFLGMLLVELGALDKLSGESEAIAKSIFALVFFYFWSSVAIIPKEYDKSKKRLALIKMFFICYIIGIVYFGFQILWSTVLVTSINFVPPLRLLFILSILDMTIRYVLLPILIWKISKKVLKEDFFRGGGQK